MWTCSCLTIIITCTSSLMSMPWLSQHHPTFYAQTWPAIILCGCLEGARNRVMRLRVSYENWWPGSVFTEKREQMIVGLGLGAESYARGEIWGCKITEKCLACLPVTGNSTGTQNFYWEEKDEEGNRSCSVAPELTLSSCLWDVLRQPTADAIESVGNERISVLQGNKSQTVPRKSCFKSRLVHAQLPDVAHKHSLTISKPSLSPSTNSTSPPGLTWSLCSTCLPNPACHGLKLTLFSGLLFVCFT